MKNTFFSSSSCYSTHNYNFEYICLCFLLYSFVARKVVMFVPPHITWSRAHRGGLSSVSFWLHHCKLWKEEEEVVVHNSQSLLFTFFWWLLNRQWQWHKEECPSFGHYFSFIIVDDDNKRRCSNWFSGFVFWSFHANDDDKRRNMVSPLTFFCFFMYMERKTMWQVFFLLSKMDINCERKKEKRWVQI